MAEEQTKKKCAVCGCEDTDLASTLTLNISEGLEDDPLGIQFTATLSTNGAEVCTKCLWSGGCFMADEYLSELTRKLTQKYPDEFKNLMSSNITFN